MNPAVSLTLPTPSEVLERIGSEALHGLLALAPVLVAFSLGLPLVTQVRGGVPAPRVAPVFVVVSIVVIALAVWAGRVPPKTLWRFRRPVIGFGIGAASVALVLADPDLRYLPVVGLLLVAFTIGQVADSAEARWWYAGLVVAMSVGLAAGGAELIDVLLGVSAMSVSALVSERRTRELLGLLEDETTEVAREEVTTGLLAAVTSLSVFDRSSIVRELLAAVAVVDPSPSLVVIDGSVHPGSRGHTLAAVIKDAQLPRVMSSRGLPVWLPDGTAGHVWPVFGHDERVLGHLVVAGDSVATDTWQHATIEQLVTVAAIALVNARRFADQRSSADRLTQLDLQRNDFVSSVSHELRTPLTVIIGLGHTLADGRLPLDSDEGRRLLGRVDANAARLETMITSLLDVSRVHRRGLEVTPSLVSLAEVVMDVSDRLESLADGHEVRVDVRDDAIVTADPSLIAHVLENLLTNAFKYTPPGTVISVEVAADATSVEVTVSDDGPGIEPSELPRVTDRFFRGGEANTRDTSGLGLGLSLVTDVLEAHDTTLEITSTPGTGSSFAFRLPRAFPLAE